MSGEEGSVEEKADEAGGEGTGLRYITTRHRAEAHNGVLIKKYILGRARMRGTFQERVQVVHVVRRDRKSCIVWLLGE